MKLLRWAVAGASVYAVYKYSTGKKAKGEDVLTSPDKTVAQLESGDASVEPVEKPKRKPRASAAKAKS
ncbi:MAG: hypothetical protein KDE55_02040 [Novosphingobium sp.]|nr:hypothetical protein [Novosphingobium sp.]